MNFTRIDTRGYLMVVLLQLWKALYLAEHGRVRVRMMRSPLVPVGQEGRAIKPLPTRALQMVERDGQGEVINWKALFKLGENWRNGASPPRVLRPDVLIHPARSVHPSNLRAQPQYERS